MSTYKDLPAPGYSDIGPRRKSKRRSGHGDKSYGNPGPRVRNFTVPGMRVELRPIKGLTRRGLFHDDKWYFQCPPMDPFTITYGHDSQEYETTFDGTFSTVASAKLDLLQFKTLMVEDNYHWLLIHDFDVKEGRDLLKDLSKSGTPFNIHCFHFKGGGSEYSGPVTLTDYIHTESEPFAYYQDVTFKEYRDPTESTKIHEHKRKGGRDWPQHHKLTAKDTLYSLAIKYYGKATAGRLIAEANHIRTSSFDIPIVKLGGKWKVGVVITLPAPPPGKPKKHKPRKTKN